MVAECERDTKRKREDKQLIKISLTAVFKQQSMHTHKKLFRSFMGSGKVPMSQNPQNRIKVH